MTPQPTPTLPETWYEGKTGNHQGLVISEATGRNVAVTYDKKDAALVAIAPELLAFVEKWRERMTNERTPVKLGTLREFDAEAQALLSRLGAKGGA